MIALMAENRVSTYPLPPMQYMNCYTDERVLSGTAPPPPPPLDSNYVMFGVQCTKEDAVIHSLESQGLRRLYPPLYDHKLELRTLNFSILANFLDLIDLLIKCPDSPERVQKLEQIKILFINMHHLINEYRPLQARDTLIEMLIHQGSVTRQTVDTAAKYLAKVDAIIGKAAAELPAPAADADAFAEDLDRMLVADLAPPAADQEAADDALEDDDDDIGEAADDDEDAADSDGEDADDAEMADEDADDLDSLLLGLPNPGRP